MARLRAFTDTALECTQYRDLFPCFSFQDEPSLNENNSTFGSMSIPFDSIHVSLENDKENTLEDDSDDRGRGEIVTSCLGRHSGTSRTASVISSAGSVAGAGEVETIQWKRGNLLGKGEKAYSFCTIKLLLPIISIIALSAVVCICIGLSTVCSKVSRGLGT